MGGFEHADFGTGWELRGDRCPSVDWWDRIIGQEFESVCEADDSSCVNSLRKGWRLDEKS